MGFDRFIGLADEVYPDRQVLLVGGTRRRCLQKAAELHLFVGGLRRQLLHDALLR